jgi:hypothetical protein
MSCDSCPASTRLAASSAARSKHPPGLLLIEVSYRLSRCRSYNPSSSLSSNLSHCPSLSAALFRSRLLELVVLRCAAGALHFCVSHWWPRCRCRLTSRSFGLSWWSLRSRSTSRTEEMLNALAASSRLRPASSFEAFGKLPDSCQTFDLI